MIKIGCPSLPFFHKIEMAKSVFMATGIFLLFFNITGLIFLLIALLFHIYKFAWFRKGWALTRSLGLKEYMLLESNLKLTELSPGKVFENHLQASLLEVIKYLSGFKKRPDFKYRTAEMRQSYFDDYKKIAAVCKSDRWGSRVYIVGTTHPNMMKWWVEAFESAGFKAIHLGYSADPGAKLGRIGWWLAQIAATGCARSKIPPGDWKTCIAVWEGGS